MTLADTAEARFKDGYSCSQSVFSALAERWNIDPELSLRVSAGFGGGMARSAGTCGCVTGAVMALGLAQPDVSPQQNRTQKDKTYELARRFMAGFEQRHGSTVCRDLLGCNIGTPEGMAEAKRKDLFQSHCSKLVRETVETVEALLGGDPRP